MTSKSLMQPIFEENFSISSQIELDTPEPKWDHVFFKRLPDSHLQRFVKMIKKPKYDQIPFYFFMRGLIEEYGISTQPDIESALAYYKKGADLNESYCLLKLYFIQRNHASEFNMEKSRDLEMLYLIKSAAYFDYYSDERYKFYPVYQLAVHLDKEDENVSKCHNLIKKYENLEIQKIVANYNLYGSQSLEEDKKKKKIECDFLDSWLSLRFYLSKPDQTNAYHRIKKLALEEKHIEACFLLSELYVGHLDGGDEYDFKKCEQMLKFCTESGLLKAFTSLASLYERMNDYPHAIDYYLKAAKKGCYRGLYEYASFVISGYMTEINFKQGIKYFIKGFWLGYMYSADHLVLILNNSEYQKKKIFSENDYEMCFEISFHLYKNYEFISNSFLKYGPQYYLVAICYEKGLALQKPSLEKALEVLTEGEKDKQLKEQKYVLYRLGRIYAKKRNLDKANEYYTKTFVQYMEIIYDEKLTKYPAQYYRVGKLFENGWGVQKNINMAIDFYKKGMKSSKYFFLLQHYYQSKCKKKYFALINQLSFKTSPLQKNSKEIVDMVLVPPKCVATLNKDSTILLWDLTQKNIVRCIYKSHNNNNENESAKQIKYLSNRCLASLGKDLMFKCWHLNKCNLIYSVSLKSPEPAVPQNYSPAEADFTILGECIGKKHLIIQTSLKNIKVFDLKKKMFLEWILPEVNLITSQVFIQNENLWVGGDNKGYLNYILFNQNLQQLEAAKNMFHNKDITSIVTFSQYNKNFLVTCSYDSKICVILYTVKNSKVKFLLERKFLNESKMDLISMTFSSKYRYFFVSDCIGKIIGFDNVLEAIVKNEKKSEQNIVEKCVLEGHFNEVSKILIADDKYLISLAGGKENFIRVWEIDSLEFIV